jgi:tRNA(Met) cytidine acetyltransferase
MELAARLHEEAVATDERRLLVLAGAPTQTREAVRVALDTTDIDPGETTYVGPDESLPCECVPGDQPTRLLGTTREAIVLDSHERCEPNTLGSLVGAVDGGGLFVLLTPPLEDWSHQRDAFDESLAVPPFERDDVSGNFRNRLVETLRTHRGIAIVDVDSDTIRKEGLVDPTPRLSESEPELPQNPDFPTAAYDQCLTQDQVETLASFERLQAAGNALVVSANRGRGKSSAAGLAGACLATQGFDVLVTAPRYRAASELFERAQELLASQNSLVELDREDTPHLLKTESGKIRFLDPVTAVEHAGDADRIIVDEAAALPVRQLNAMLEVPSVAFTTTIHGYEGTGRGFSVRFRDHLEASSHSVTETEMTAPIRYAPQDPIEVWSFRALALDARPPVEPRIEDAFPASVTYREFSADQLRADEHLLREVFGLLVLAHYRTEPNDLARVLDAPNVSVHGLVHDGHVVSVALLAREGDLSPDIRNSMYTGDRIRGNLVPDVLTSQLRDEQAAKPVGMRVMRIATHGAVRSRGLGSKLLAEIESAATDLDWLGVGYGATPELVDFWSRNGFSSVHLSTTRNERSGEHSAVMLSPLSSAGGNLLDRHAGRFLRRLPSMLADSLSTIDPDVVRAVCRSASGTPAIELTPWEWRHAVAIADGPGIFEMAPRAVRTLAFRHLVDPADDVLSPTEERLLVRRALQAHPRERVARELEYPSEAECMRTFGRVVDTLLDLYGNEKVDAERRRLR